ncbi:MAG: hypothetical protein Q4P84_01110 [Elusimicrobiales bacterium]|nr:hypothetical protein [Elusimicrobiales bacterium]
MMQYVFEGFKFWQKWKLIRLLPLKLKGADKPIRISLNDTIPKHQYSSLWYGGLVATVQYGDLLVDLEANGDVIADLYDCKGPDERLLEYIKDKSNLGEFGSVMRCYIQTDKELDELLRNGHKRYYLELCNNNWWECVPCYKGNKYYPESWITESDDIWSAIAEIVDYLVSGRCFA